VERWRLFAGLIYLHLLLANLAEQGTLGHGPSDGPFSAGSLWIPSPTRG
jgi:hypothetical protein